MEEEVVIGYAVQKEQEAIISWLRNWKGNERSVFLNTLRGLIAPQIDDLLGTMNSCKIQNDWTAPNVFACQMKLLRDWFRLWDEVERAHFGAKLRAHLEPDELAFLQNNC